MARLFALLRKSNSGVWASLGSSVIWGSLPLYWYLLREFPPLYVLCHRVVWACLFLFPLVVALRRVQEVANAARNARTLRILFCSSLVLAVNWGVYIWAVNNGKVVEASLGYFINPLITICMGVVFFRDRPRPIHWVAIAVAFAGVGAEIGISGSVPWAALALSITFSCYGLLRKISPVESLPGLAMETGILLPFSLAFIVWCHYSGIAAVSGAGGVSLLLLVGSGVITSVPLILFAYGARHLQLMTLGILQYLSPLLTALLGLFAFHEPLTLGRALSLGSVWLALVLYTADSFRQHVRAREKS
ncbi:RarD protein, DMT superfamily transporter [uncultured delta proteobacterium]|uniref:RarD protein, DMT superfamily transporter n=1 Tax=uncultured delta proteobacterium TaxID=34034 RepID=A0A212KHA5_9DELT|nr:RarD protein, DMT superfamily transporter [uncultured delta proteobacterium]